jgi:hypothetical protein
LDFKKGFDMSGGGGGSSSSKSDTNTTSTDQRVAVQDGVGLSGSSGNTINVNNTDAVKAIAQLGADAIRSTGEAVVQLNETSTQVNALTWDKTLNASAGLIDRLIDSATASYGVAQNAIERYQPSENKTIDSTNIAMLAAAGVAAVLLIKGRK